MKSISALILATLFIVSAGAPGRAQQSTENQKASQLLKQVTTETRSLTSMTADLVDIETQGGKTVQRTGTVKMMKPNYLFEEVWPSGATHDESAPHEILASDGQSYWQIASDGTLFKEVAAPNGQNVGNTDSISGSTLPDMAGFIALFFNPDMITQVDPNSKTDVVSQTWNGQTYQVVSQTIETKDPSGKSATITAKLYIGTDNLIHRLSIDITTLGSLELQLLNLKSGVGLTKADFAFTPPSWAQPPSLPAAPPTPAKPPAK